MSFRFSLKWMLAAMVYAAVAAAALTQNSWLYVDVLWLGALAAVGFAVLLTVYARGERQARAVGFVVLAAGFLLWMYAAPHSMPTRHLVNALPGAEAISQVQVYPAPMPVIAPAAPTTAAPTAPRYVSPYAPTPVAPAIPPGALTVAYASAPGYAFQISASNAVGAMAAGLVGCLLGGLAYRRAQPRMSPD
jgi:hypothetical protein